MKYLYLLLITWLPVAAIGQSKRARKESKMEDKAANMIATLPDIMQADDYCQKKSHGKRHLETYVEEDESGNGYYWVKVAEDNGTAYHTWYEFKVMAKSYKIFYEDTDSGKDVPMEVWRRRKDYLGLD